MIKSVILIAASISLSGTVLPTPENTPLMFPDTTQTVISSPQTTVTTSYLQGGR
jgi:hypothetical protein